MYTINLNISSWTTPVNGGGYIQALPFMDGVSLKRERDSNSRQIVRTKISGEFVFRNIRGSHQEFTQLKALRDSGDTFIEAKIYYSGNERLTGIINLNTGTWDDNKKMVSLMFQQEDEYNELLNGISNEYNIKEVGVETVKMASHSKLYYIDTPCTALSSANFEITTAPNMTTATGSRAAEWNLYTLTATTPCSGGNVYTYVTSVITFHNTKYTANQYAVVKAMTEGGDHMNFIEAYGCANDTTTELVEWVEFTEFIKLYNIIEYILSELDSTISISESTYAAYLTDDNPEYNYIMLADKSDVINYTASNKALYENITFASLMSLCKMMFNLDWAIEGGYFKLKRPEVLSLPSFVSYPCHDFTDLNFNSSIVDNQQRYTYLSNYKFAKETWVFEDSYYWIGKFIGSYFPQETNYVTESIYYNSVDELTVNNDILNINNNLEFMILDPTGIISGDIPERPEESGFVIISTELSAIGRVVSYDFDNTKEFYEHPTNINHLMSANYLVDNHQLTDRPYNKGTINAVETSLTKRPDREVSYSNVPVWDIDDIDFGYLVKCDVGNVTPESFEVDLTLKSFSKFKGVF